MRYPLGPHPTNASTGDPAEPTHAADTSVKTPNHTPRNKVADALIITTTASANDPAEPTLAADTGVETPDPTPLDTKVVDDPAADDLIVTTTAGTIRGLRLTIPGPLRTWRGVPYGDTTAGNHRFRAPHPAPRWDGIKDCTEYGAIAAQPSLTPSDRIRGNEDCLNLDIVRPDDDRTLPVVVYLHGGSFIYGSSHQQVPRLP